MSVGELSIIVSVYMYLIMSTNMPFIIVWMGECDKCCVSTLSGWWPWRSWYGCKFTQQAVEPWYVLHQTKDNTLIVRTRKNIFPSGNRAESRGPATELDANVGSGRSVMWFGTLEELTNATPSPDKNTDIWQKPWNRFNVVVKILAHTIPACGHYQGRQLTTLD